MTKDQAEKMAEGIAAKYHMNPYHGFSQTNAGLVPDITTSLIQAEMEGYNRAVKVFRDVDERKWDDAHHCSCLGFALHRAEFHDGEGCDLHCKPAQEWLEKVGKSGK